MNKMVQVLVKDGEDARDLVDVVWGQCCVVFSMLRVGAYWRVAGDAGLVWVWCRCCGLYGKCEVRNKRARKGLLSRKVFLLTSRELGSVGLCWRPFKVLALEPCVVRGDHVHSEPRSIPQLRHAFTSVSSSVGPLPIFTVCHVGPGLLSF